MRIDPQVLSPEALLGVIESFILREGTDYGAVEVSLDAKIAQVRRQIEQGEAVVVFDPVTETVDLVTRQEWSRVGR